LPRRLFPVAGLADLLALLVLPPVLQHLPRNATDVALCTPLPLRLPARTIPPGGRCTRVCRRSRRGQPQHDVHSLPSISTMHRRALARQLDHDVFQLSSLRVTLPTQGDSLSQQRNLAIDKRPCVGGYHLGCLLLAHDSGCSMTAWCCLSNGQRCMPVYV